jgi:hypothetical protein
MQVIFTESQLKQIQQILKESEQINEAHWLNYVADVAGIFDPTGVIDIGNGLSYLYQGETFFGMLSLISAIPYLGDLAAKPLMLAGRGSKVIRLTNDAMKVAKTNPAKATRMMEQIGKLMDQVRVWAPKLRKMVDSIPTGKMGQPLKNTINDAIMFFEKVGAGSRKASKIAKNFSKKTMSSEEATSVLKQIRSAAEQDAQLFRLFGGSAARGIKGFEKYKASGMPRLFGNKATRSLMRRTKFWAGFLDYLGLGNFVGPDELSKQMGNQEFNSKMNEYSQTQEAKQNWETEFGGVSQEEPTQQTQTQTSSSETSSDPTRDFFTNLIFGPLTGKAI